MFMSLDLCILDVMLRRVFCLTGVTGFLTETEICFHFNSVGSCQCYYIIILYYIKVSKFEVVTVKMQLLLSKCSLLFCLGNSLSSV